MGKRILSLVFGLFLFATPIAFADIIDDVNEIEKIGTGTTPKVIAGVLLLAVAGAIAFTVLGGPMAPLGIRLAVSILTVVVTYLIIVNTEVGVALNDMLNIQDPKAMFNK